MVWAKTCWTTVERRSICRCSSLSHSSTPLCKNGESSVHLAGTFHTSLTSPIGTLQQCSYRTILMILTQKLESAGVLSGEIESLEEYSSMETVLTSIQRFVFQFSLGKCWTKVYPNDLKCSINRKVNKILYFINQI